MEGRACRGGGRAGEGGRGIGGGGRGRSLGEGACCRGSGVGAGSLLVVAEGRTGDNVAGVEVGCSCCSNCLGEVGCLVVVVIAVVVGKVVVLVEAGLVCSGIDIVVGCGCTIAGWSGHKDALVVGWSTCDHAPVAGTAVAVVIVVVGAE